jgi:hypothetical protein
VDGAGAVEDGEVAGAETVDGAGVVLDGAGVVDGVGVVVTAGVVGAAVELVDGELGTGCPTAAAVAGSVAGARLPGGGSAAVDTLSGASLVFGSAKPVPEKAV